MLLCHLSADEVWNRSAPAVDSYSLCLDNTFKQDIASRSNPRKSFIYAHRVAFAWLTCTDGSGYPWILDGRSHCDPLVFVFIAYWLLISGWSTELPTVVSKLHPWSGHTAHWVKYYSLTHQTWSTDFLDGLCCISAVTFARLLTCSKMHKQHPRGPVQRLQLMEVRPSMQLWDYSCQHTWQSSRSPYFKQNPNRCAMKGEITQEDQNN